MKNSGLHSFEPLLSAAPIVLSQHDLSQGFNKNTAKHYISITYNPLRHAANVSRNAGIDFIKQHVLRFGSKLLQQTKHCNSPHLSLCQTMILKDLGGFAIEIFEV